ncbi:MAG TPA: DUF6748 domain-containing protein [Candidatus Nanopelagicales bacterium]|nr:DUF6748 domain-containing protein [Candidatus Nanopelagicales bacterium]
MNRIATWLAGVLAASGVGCTVLAYVNEPNESREQGASGYFVVTRPDLRRCAAPLCGGHFVKLVNQPLTRCADGELREECHAYDVDLSATGLDPRRAAAFERLFGERHGVARGTLRLAWDERGIAVDTLEVGEAWRGIARSEPRGMFYSVSDSGIVCVTNPCPSILESPLNTSEQRRIHEVDLAAPGVSREEVRMGLDALFTSGILVAGTHRTITGPAGAGTELVASEWYMREPVSGAP